MPGIGAQAFWERYEQVKAIEHSKNELIEREKLDHERETRFNRDIQIHEMELMDQIKRIKKIMDREPFIIVLLDGDGMIFQDHFIQNGEQGGKDAANQLWAALTQYVARNLPNVSSPKIVTRIYANVKGLGHACHQAGIIESPSLMEDFVRGFNESRLLFDFVDVGSGKDRADDKIAETFKLNLYNCHCHQIFLGCSHDNGYARLLEETLADRELTGRISLIEGVPFEKELESIKASYRVTQFQDLFRTTKLTPKMASSNGTSKPQVVSQPQTMLSPHQGPASLTRTSTNTTSSSSSTPASFSSWASVTASNPGDVSLQSSKPANPSPQNVVERNKYGQRIDRFEFKSIPKEEMNRIKKMKLCNLHFLLGDCPNTNCHHDHTHKLTKNEKVVLQAIARMTPCRFGMECDDPKCIYGHRCPLSEPGKKNCFWGSNCRFDPSQHGIDTTVVKVTKI
ncbi:C-x8-C-x5-C-x3-H zinc finger protein [Rasamsonia emersonii CBS 393.64]|uniref:C-x8-C-x5-C-x3-H zinc finger protein n=1 Tax=Rasamsonia emersonii (strain ATCC 16479 / CBS 393.64 / IMI 116815) TaxID=1408163 RepID=A0A0F4Z6E7_RASE3|nr:C-x8-C-x5-C-x3-H zinc finger protein [Rasamsonia emersonii CBS 393.64]KKA25646.1 C-x8-C-x5-C-x3-H zinc finger protein [Rasamsonia emersonii CBS 393.64]